MLTFFIALLHLALLVEAGRHTQRRAAQNGNDTALLIKRSNLTDIEFDKRMLARLFGSGRPSLPTSQQVPLPIQSVKLKHKETSWIMPLDIGMPVQHLDVKLDTDSSCFWTHSLSWSITRKSVEAPSTHDCRIRHLPKREDFIISGKFYMDKIRVGEVQQRGMVLLHQGTSARHSVLGLSFRQEDPQSENQMAFVHSVLGKAFPHPVFALYLVENSGELHMGGPRPGYYKEDTIEYHEVTSPSSIQRWQIGSAVIGVNGNEGLIPKFETVFDTTAFFITGPKKIVKRIYRELREPGDDRAFHKYYLFPCHTQVRLYLKWNNGREWVIDHNIFNLGSVSRPEFSDMCKGLIRGGDGDVWIIGTEFMKTLYLVFNATMPKPQIALAQFASVPAYSEIIADPPAYQENPPAHHDPLSHHELPPQHELPPEHEPPPQHEPPPYTERP